MASDQPRGQIAPVLVFLSLSLSVGNFRPHILLFAEIELSRRAARSPLSTGARVRQISCVLRHRIRSYLPNSQSIRRIERNHGRGRHRNFMPDFIRQRRISLTELQKLAFSMSERMAKAQVICIGEFFLESRTERLVKIGYRIVHNLQRMRNRPRHASKGGQFPGIYRKQTRESVLNAFIASALIFLIVAIFLAGVSESWTWDPRNPSVGVPSSLASDSQNPTDWIGHRFPIDGEPDLWTAISQPRCLVLVTRDTCSRCDWFLPEFCDAAAKFADSPLKDIPRFVVLRIRAGGAATPDVPDSVAAFAITSSSFPQIVNSFSFPLLLLLDRGIVRHVFREPLDLRVIEYIWGA